MNKTVRFGPCDPQAPGRNSDTLNQSSIRILMCAGADHPPHSWHGRFNPLGSMQILTFGPSTEIPLSIFNHKHTFSENKWRDTIKRVWILHPKAQTEGLLSADRRSYTNAANDASCHAWDLPDKGTITGPIQLALSLACSTHTLLLSRRKELTSSAWVCAAVELSFKNKNEQQGQTSLDNHGGDCFV